MVIIQFYRRLIARDDDLAAIGSAHKFVCSQYRLLVAVDAQAGILCALVCFFAADSFVVRKMGISCFSSFIYTS